MEKKSKTLRQALDDPDLFYDFTNGVDMDDEEIKDKIHECIRNVRDSNEDTTYSISCGNTMVHVTYLVGAQSAEIIVCKNYKRGTLFLKEGGVVEIGGIPIRKTSKSGWSVDHKLLWDD